MSRFGRVAAATLLPVAVAALAACTSGGVGGATGTPGLSPLPSAATSIEPSMSAEPSAAPSASAGASSALNQVFPKFVPEAGSTITGGAILTDLGNGQTAVTIGVVAAGITDPMPANLVPGSCAAGAPAASAPAASAPAASGSAGASLAAGSTVKLGDLTAGASNTVVAMSLDDILASPYSIQIVKSAADSTVVACADVTR
jgi:hypothetical protein